MVSNNKRKRKNKKSIKKADAQQEPEHAGNEVIDGEEANEPRKREHIEDDSDNEEKPRKKKKKKQAQPQEESSDKKGKKSIRQMKREKFAQRQLEAQSAAKDHLKGQCITYLSQWKHDRQNWKFMKSKQVWLYKNKFSSSLVPDTSWSTLLEYFESAKGNIRNMLLDDANKVIKQMDEWTESQNGKSDDNEDDIETKKPDDASYKRARDIIQCLQE